MSGAKADRLLLLMHVVALEVFCLTEMYLQEALKTIPRNQAELEFFPIFSLPEKNRLMKKNTTRFGPKKIWQ